MEDSLDTKIAAVAIHVVRSLEPSLGYTPENFSADCAKLAAEIRKTIGHFAVERA